MNKKGIFQLIFAYWYIILAIIIIVILYLSFKPQPYKLCTENPEEIEAYIKLYKIEIGKRWKENNKVCYESYDKEAYLNLVNLTNELEYKKFKDKLELEDKNNQRKWDFIERNKFYIGGIGIFILIFVVYMYFKHKNK